MRSGLSKAKHPTSGCRAGRDDRLGLDKGRGEIDRRDVARLVVEDVISSFIWFVQHHNIDLLAYQWQQHPRDLRMMLWRFPSD